MSEQRHLFNTPSLSPDEDADLKHTRELFETSDTFKYDKVVAFVDMLGFSALTEQHRVEPEVMEVRPRRSSP